MNSKSSCILACISAIIALAVAEEKALSYTSDNFASSISEKAHFVKFFAPWCGHCKNLAPTWEELAEKFNTEDSDATVAKVDCTVETKLCADNDVSGYPTLKFFAKGATEGTPYRGQRSLVALEAFIGEQTGKTPEPVKEEEKKEEKEAEEKKEDHFYADLTADSFDAHIKTGHHFIKFYAPWCGHCKRLEPAWNELAADFKDNKQVSVARVDCTEHRPLCSRFDVGGYPTLLFFANGEKVEKYQGAREKDALLAFMKKMIGDEKKVDASEEMKEETENKEAVVTLTADSFKDFIATGTTFVKFYAPWCGHCKRLAPTWEDLAKKYESSSNVKIAKVDCTTDREVCSDNAVRGFPTLVLFRNGEKLQEHNGGRDMDALVETITSNMPRDEL